MTRQGVVLTDLQSLLAVNKLLTSKETVSCVLVLVLALYRCAVTVSSTGAENQFQGDDNGDVGRPCQVSPALPFPRPELL